MTRFFYGLARVQLSLYNENYEGGRSEKGLESEVVSFNVGDRGIGVPCWMR